VRAVGLSTPTTLPFNPQLTLLALEETLCRDRTGGVGLFRVLSRPIQIVTPSELHNHTRLVLNKMPSSVRTALAPYLRADAETTTSVGALKRSKAARMDQPASPRRTYRPSLSAYIPHTALLQLVGLGRCRHAPLQPLRNTVS
jgi:hypothetical protein